MSKEKLRQIDFFICSTFTDLEVYRRAVIDKIKSQKGVINAQEFFGARDNKPLATCLEEVAKSKVFIIILAYRHGSIDDETGKSFVELEYEKARELGLPKFAYIHDGSQSFVPRDMDQNQEKINTFKDRIKSELTVNTFSTPDDLADRVFSDLVRELPAKGFDINKSAGEEHESAALKERLFKFSILPKVYYGWEFEVKAKLGRIQSASKKKCNAFSLEHGATMTRDFDLGDERSNDIFVGLPREVIASDELAKKIIDCPSDKFVRLSLKTVYGEVEDKTPIYETEDYGPPDLITGSVYLMNSLFRQRRQVIVGYDVTTDLLKGFVLTDLNE